MMKTKQAYIILLIIMLVVAVGIGGYFFYMQQQKPAPVDNSIYPVQPGIDVTLPKANEVVTSPLKVAGSVNGEGWAGFEGQVGTVKLLDPNGRELATGVLAATTDWTKFPVTFETSLVFISTPGNGFLVFHNENASGLPDRDKTFILPVTFK